MGIINSIGKKFRSIASSPFGNALLTSASRRLSAAGLPFGGLFGTQDQNFAINSFDRQGDATDWRVKLTLGGAQNNPLATEMQQPVLQPLAEFGCMVFPITPTILVQHVAHYNAQGLVHTNYPFYAYQNSETMAININGTLPVSNEEEVKYWIATVHFLRTITKMYYGNSDNQGNPPPVCRLNGYGDFVYKDVPVVVTNFNVELREAVDYIGVSVPTSSKENLPAAGTGAEGSPNQKFKQSQLGQVDPGFRRALAEQQADKVVDGNVNYVPTDSLIAVTCLPIYSRNKISNEFNLKAFAEGKIVKGSPGGLGGFI